jgi:molybdopterin converting factor small subunit
MEVSVRLFGAEASAAGRREVRIDLPPGGTCADLLRLIGAEVEPLRGRLGHCRLAVNHDFAPPQRVLSAGDEVALIGLVSGG